MNKQHINIEEFELEKPFNYEEILQNTDNLFAELLVRYHLDQGRKALTNEDFSNTM